MNRSFNDYVRKVATVKTPTVANVHIRDAASRREEALSDMLIIGSQGTVSLGAAIYENDIEYTPPA